MNAVEIISLLKNSQNISQVDLQKIEHELAIKPWFSALHLLKAKTLHNNGSSLFNGALKNAAIYSGDRSVLYHFIHDFEVPYKTVKSDTGAVDFPEEVYLQKDISVPEIIVNAEKSDKDENTPETHLNENNTDVVSVDTNKESDQIAEPESDAQETQQDHIEENPVIEKDHVEIQQTKESEFNLIDDEGDEVPEIDLNKEVESRIKVVYNPTKELSKFLKPLEPETEHEPISKKVFYDPEKELANYNQPSESEKKSDTHDFSYWLEHFDEKETAPPQLNTFDKTPKPDATELLDNFIKNRPSISKGKAEFFNPENVAKKSEELHLDLVSESLAQLFEKQGKIEQALDIYEKLKLQKPNNIAYFATRIKELKDLLK